MPIGTPEQASLCGCLDSSPINAGAAAHAHTLRAIGMTANRILARGCVMGVMPFYAGGPGFGDGNIAHKPSSFMAAQASWVMFGSWQQVYWNPIVLPKSPSKRLMEVQGVIKVDASQTCYLQVCTSARPFRPNLSISDPSVIACTGDGTRTWQVFSAPDVPMGSDEWEHVSLYIQATPIGSLAPTGTYGNYNSGTLDFASTNEIGDSTSSWTTSVNNGSLYCNLTDASGGLVMPSRRVLYTRRDLAGSVNNIYLGIIPSFTAAEQQLFQSGTAMHYELRLLTPVAFASLSFYEQDRVL